MREKNITFHHLYKKYSADVYRFAFWLSGDDADAKDITSETFVRVFISGKEPRSQTVKAYLFTIARNLYLKNRKRKKRFVVLENDQIDKAKQTSVDLEVHSTISLVREAVNRLPEIDRSILLMKAEEDMSYKDISQVTGMSVASIKVRIFRARKKINEYLQEG